jgi:alkylhydroperoxidase family enzyme
MARIRLAPQDIAEPAAVVQAVRSRREGGVLNEADLAVFRAPRFARGWNELSIAVRKDTGVPLKLVELAIITVGVVNDSPFEISKHAPAFFRAGGTQAQFDALQDLESALNDTALFDEIERATISLSFEMTRSVKVTDATFNQIARLLASDELLVELIGAIGMYNMVTRVLGALEIEES